MGHDGNGYPAAEPIKRRSFLAGATAISAGLLPGTADAQSRTGLDDNWSAEYVRSIAGTLEVDTAAECAKVVPLSHKGELSYWYVGPNQATPRIDQEMDDQFWAAFGKTYPNITVRRQNVSYDAFIQKLRTAALGGAAPTVARTMLLWSPELAAKGLLQELRPDDVGYSTSDFWPGAMRSCTWEGKTYGIPSNNESLAFAWNAALFRDAGLDPERCPDTWDEVVQYSRTIKEKTGKNGYGMVARVNAGNTPYRFMPQVWAYGGGALDEAEPNPTFKAVRINGAGTKAALQASYDMYVRDRSVPVSALTNTQNENQDPFLAGQLGMMVAHPYEYVVMEDRAKRATGTDRKTADEVIANMRYGLTPQGPARRATVFGGNNIHLFKPDVVEGKYDQQAALAFIAFVTGPEWSVKNVWSSSNPGNRRAFRTAWMKERMEQSRFLAVSTAMLKWGIPFPVVPQSTEILNVIVPEMLQNALTKRMTVEASAEAAARRIRDVLGRG